MQFSAGKNCSTDEHEDLQNKDAMAEYISSVQEVYIFYRIYVETSLLETPIWGREMQTVSSC